MITTRKIGPADGALEDHVPDDRDAVPLVHEYHVSRGVTGAMPDPR